MIQKLSAISEFFGRFPSIGFMFLYILAIPSFAAIYTFCIPSHFYHSTVQYEGILDKDADIILSKIRKAITQEFIKFHGGPVKSDNKWKIDISEIYATSLKTESDSTSFNLSIRLNGVNTYEGTLFSLTMKCSIRNKIAYMVSAPPKHENIVYKQPVCENGSSFPMGLKTLFPATTNDLNSKLLWLPISEETQNAITAFVKATKGFPSNVSGVYTRMFYFSAVTITTLGYGDIVPITNVARIFVVLESVLGLVLIGMFLNSLSRESKGV
jgi:hypothetical protein